LIYFHYWEIRNQESGIRNQESGIRNQESGIRNWKILKINPMGNSFFKKVPTLTLHCQSLKKISIVNQKVIM